MKTLVFLLLTSCAYGQSAPDVLAEVAKRPPLGLEDFERYALTANPTLKQANSLTKQTAASAEQAGLYPNPMVGYQGEQIRRRLIRWRRAGRLHSADIRPRWEAGAGETSTGSSSVKTKSLLEYNATG